MLHENWEEMSADFSCLFTFFKKIGRRGTFSLDNTVFKTKKGQMKN